MKIQEVQIEGLFGKKDILWKLNPQVNVLVGENGSGKSKLLMIIHSSITKIISETITDLTFGSIIQLSNKKIYFYYKNKDEILEELTKKFKEEWFKEGSNKNNLREEDFIHILEGITPQYRFYELTPDNHKLPSTNKPENIYIDLITSNLTNSNANHIIQKSNQEKTNALDMEIRETIYELNKIQSNEIIERLVISLNSFFSQIDKQVSYKNNELIYTDIQLKKQLNYSDLSSGERQLIYILLRVALSNQDKNKTAIILMDEPEISLHVNWQSQFIKQLTLLNPDAQFIIVTHSPAIIMNGWNDMYVTMEEITQ
ncbi:AAA family ATPase [Moraxella oblonga]|uniref:AAA family ATPase n=1 Tax=Moraxella oblonga TaxID=200413 RepID=UPI00083108AC|nr:ATP-binding protein [Moraxella oblonga]